MALAWVSWSPERKVFEVDTGSNRFYELYLSTRPELMKPDLAPQRTPTNFYSTRASEGRLLPSSGGRALFPLPQQLAERFPNGSIYFVVKTFADEAGKSPSLSPVLGGNPSHVVLSDVDPAGGTPMGTSVIDLEDFAARLTPTQTSASNGSATRRRSVATSTSKAPVRVARGDGRAIAASLGLVCRNVRETCAADPRIPGKPSYRSTVEAVSAALALVPTPGGGPSLAATANGMISGRGAHGDGKQLARHILAAGSRSSAQERSREQFAFLAALAPMLMQALPSLLPMLLPLIQNLLGGLGKSSSLEAAAQPPVDTAALIKAIVEAVAKGAAAQAAQKPPAAATPPPAGTPAPPPATPVVAKPTPTPPPAAQQPPPQQVAAAPAMDADAAAKLMGALQGFGGAQGEGGNMFESITGHSASPGTDMLKSVIERLPIDKMFDPNTWMPSTEAYDQWRATLPWDQVLSLSDPTASFGALFVPGKRGLKPLEGVTVTLVDRTTTKVAGGDESWVFVCDRPARFHVEVAAGPEGVSRPFVDVRVSRDGTPATGISRSVYRLRTLGASERRRTTIELPPDVLAQAAADGGQTCVSVRVVTQDGDEHRATELRACFYVVRPHSVVVESRAAVEEAPELDALAGLERRVPSTALGGEVRAVDWRVDAVGRGEGPALAQYLPVVHRATEGEQTLEGGLAFSPLGLADLAKRRDGVELGASELTALADAIDAGAALRARMSLRVRESVEPQLLTRAEKALGIRTELGWLPAYLVSFSGAGDDGNPTRRDVRRVGIPVPRGIELRAS